MLLRRTSRSITRYDEYLRLSIPPLEGLPAPLPTLRPLWLTILFNSFEDFSGCSSHLWWTLHCFQYFGLTNGAFTVSDISVIVRDKYEPNASPRRQPKPAGTRSVNFFPKAGRLCLHNYRVTGKHRSVFRKLAQNRSLKFVVMRCGRQGTQ